MSRIIRCRRRLVRVVAVACMSFGVWLAPGGAFADPDNGGEGAPTTDAEQLFYVEVVLIDGLNRTERYVIERELLFEAGEKTTLSEVEESIQRIRNTSLFRLVEYELIDGTVPLETKEGDADPPGPAHRVLRIRVDERWTLLPTFGFNFGGGTFSFVAGVWDINFLGRFLEVGGRFQRLGDTNSFSVWFANPRTFDQRLASGVQLAWTNRVRVLYDDNAEVSGGYLRFRRSVGAFANREWLWWLRTGLSLSYIDTEYGTDLVPDSALDAQRAVGLPEPTRSIPLSGTLSLGRIDEHNYLFDGVSWSQNVAHSEPGWGANIRYTRYATSVRFFERLPLKSNLALRVGFGTTSADHVEQQFFLGGFGTIRGFVDSRFRGAHYWYGNGELRVPSLDTRWVVLQHIGFLDAGRAAGRLAGLGDVSGASAGVGLRIISPKIHSFIIRIDYAFPFHGNGFSPLSFGAQHFF